MSHFKLKQLLKQKSIYTFIFKNRQSLSEYLIKVPSEGEHFSYGPGFLEKFDKKMEFTP